MSTNSSEPVEVVAPLEDAGEFLEGEMLQPGEAEVFSRLVDTVFVEEDFSDCYKFID